MTRPSWDEYFLELARLVATRSVCERRQVGCVLVRDRHIMATGYCGPPRGMKHCDELGGCYRDRMNIPSGERLEIGRCLHAEQNAIIQAAIHGTKLEPPITCYITTQPCLTCSKMLINAGVTHVVWVGDHPDKLGIAMLDQAGVGIVQVSDRGDECTDRS